MSSKCLLTILACCVVGASASSSLAQGCQPEWVAGFAEPGMADAYVVALATFDDGGPGGPALFAGGSFSEAGGITVHGVAKWDGTTWTSLNGGITESIPGYVEALQVFDDGSGPALYVGGTFHEIGGVSIGSGIAKWDGKHWTHVGGGLNGYVYCFEVFDDGSGGGPQLYVGGRFSGTSSGTPMLNLAKWNGAQWSEVGGGVGAGTDNYVRTLKAFDDGDGPALFVGGQFPHVGDNYYPTNDVARWNGSAWDNMNGGVAGVYPAIGAMTVYDDGSGDGPSLLVAGPFTSAGGQTMVGMARWRSAGWSPPPGSPDNGGVGCFQVIDQPDGQAQTLYVGGSFSSISSVTARGIARFDGTTWSDVAGSLDYAYYGEVWTMTSAVIGNSQPALVAAGYYPRIGGIAVKSIASYDGEAWHSLGNGATENPIWSLLAVNEPALGGEVVFAGGAFGSAGGTPNPGPSILRWDGQHWGNLGNGLSSAANALAVWSPDVNSPRSLYAGGNFTLAGGAPASRIAKWDGNSWSPLAAGLNGVVTSIFPVANELGDGPALYVGGAFTQAGGVNALGIARWDGAQWSSVGSGLGMYGGVVNAMAIFDDGTGPALYATGDFDETGDGTKVHNIAKWNGKEWVPLGAGIPGGSFGWGRSLAVFDDHSGSGPALYVGGHFTMAGGNPIPYIARWDGQTWSSVGGGVNDWVEALCVFDDGSGKGPALYATGFFSQAGGQSAGRIAKWDGKSWSALDTGLTGGTQFGPQGDVMAAAQFANESALYIGGDFDAAGGIASSRIAKWGCTPSIPCPADINADHVVNSGDLLALFNSWGICRPVTCHADTNGDGVVNSADLLAVLNEWGQCP